jgi:hypothetical protein
MWFLTLFLIPVAAALYEYRLRRPDHLILYDSNGTIGFRTSRWYPRHFSLALPGTTHPMEVTFEASAMGSMPVIVKMTVAVAASRESIAALIRMGGWNGAAVPKAASELENVLHGQVRAYAEKVGLEDLSPESLRDHLMKRAEICRQDFGLDIVSLTVQSIDPVDPSIAEALRQRESARLLEQTEILNQNARVAAAEAKLTADDRIMHLEHELALKKFTLSGSEQEKEAELARRRVEEELKCDRMKLEFDREELSILKEHPHLLLLTPQAARLAEASQSLKNARTVIGLAPGDAEQGARLMGLFQMLLESSTNNTPKQVEKKNK